MLGKLNGMDRSFYESTMLLAKKEKIHTSGLAKRVRHVKQPNTYKKKRFLGVIFSTHSVERKF